MKRFKFLRNDNFIPLFLLLLCLIGLFLVVFMDKYGNVNIELEEFTEEKLILLLTVLCAIALIPVVYLFFKIDKK